jgi:hypothetical protein
MYLRKVVQRWVMNTVGTNRVRPIPNVDRSVPKRFNLGSYWINHPRIQQRPSC